MALNKVTCTHPYEHNLGKGTGNGNQMGMTIDIEHKKGKWSEDISLE